MKTNKLIKIFSIIAAVFAALVIVGTVMIFAIPDASKAVFGSVVSFAKFNNFIGEILSHPNKETGSFICMISTFVLFFVMIVLVTVFGIIRKKKYWILLDLLFLVICYLNICYIALFRVLSSDPIENPNKWQSLLVIDLFLEAIAFLALIPIFVDEIVLFAKRNKQVQAKEEVKVEGNVVNEPVYVKEAKPVEEKAEVKEKEEVKKTPTPVKKKTAAKKVAAKKEAAKKEAKKEEPKAEKVNDKIYHVSRRPELNKWQVKAAGSNKSVKLFNTQKEAVEYALTLTGGNKGYIRIHSVQGKMRQ